jgi:signal transduction histidine kinase
VTLTIEGGVDETSFPIQRAVFRVIQEALANAHKHGCAKHMSVQLARGVDGLLVKVVDDGHSSQLQIVPGIGIPGMEARIERFGGVLSVTLGKTGTTVSAFIPAAALEDH